MGAESIIRKADQAGISLWLERGKIAVRPISKLSPDLRHLINAHREEVVQHLSGRPNPANLIQQTIQVGIFQHGVRFAKEEIAALVPPSDWRDVSRCVPDELRAWAAALALRAVRYRGMVPTGWDLIARCANCGPVYSFAAGECLACPWCEIKRAGKWFPVPLQDQ